MRIVFGLACLLLSCVPAGAAQEGELFSGCRDLAPKPMPSPAGKGAEMGEDPALWLPKLVPPLKTPMRSAEPCLK